MRAWHVPVDAASSRMRKAARFSRSRAPVDLRIKYMAPGAPAMAMAISRKDYGASHCKNNSKFYPALPLL